MGLNASLIIVCKKKKKTSKKQKVVKAFLPLKTPQNYSFFNQRLWTFNQGYSDVGVFGLNEVHTECLLCLKTWNQFVQLKWMVRQNAQILVFCMCKEWNWTVCLPALTLTVEHIYFYNDSAKFYLWYGQSTNRALKIQLDELCMVYHDLNLFYYIFTLSFPVLLVCMKFSLKH